ncbi:methyltransferase domain-containing protein [Streptomyces sp. NPDC044984]|uniref:methyltransferase domain-containing protein n=1 Tax=Streptomyces sp. NPDC044984 TaxID=3154335 RepID=UPI0033F97428
MTIKHEYFADRAGHREESTRLEKIQESRDRTTRRHLRSLGVSAGWRCLEVGPGAGSIARWMAGRVGPEGHVVAADINPRFLTSETAPNLEVRVHDITTDAFEEAAYDLVHARLVLMHLPDPLAALKTMVAALRPGGRLLVEEGDLLGVEAVTRDHPDAGTFVRVMETILRHTRTRKAFDLNLGRLLPGMLRSLSLADVDNEATFRVLKGGEDTFRSPFEVFRDGVLASGEVTENEWDISHRCFDDPHFSWMGMPLVAAWGTKPPV